MASGGGIMFDTSVVTESPIVERARARWLDNKDVLELLNNFSAHGLPVQSDPIRNPKSQYNTGVVPEFLSLRFLTHACVVRPWVVVWACRWLLVRVQPGCDAQLQAGRRAPHYARRSHHVCEYQAFGSRALRVLARPPDSVRWHRPRRATCG